jgi:hypothetical protein
MNTNIFQFLQHETVLTKEGEDSILIKYLLNDAQQWNGLRRSLCLHVSKLNEFLGDFKNNEVLYDEVWRVEKRRKANESPEHSRDPKRKYNNPARRKDEEFGTTKQFSEEIRNVERRREANEEHLEHSRNSERKDHSSAHREGELLGAIEQLSEEIRKLGNRRKADERSPEHSKSSRWKYNNSTHYEDELLGAIKQLSEEIQKLGSRRKAYEGSPDHSRDTERRDNNSARRKSEDLEAIKQLSEEIRNFEKECAGKIAELEERTREIIELVGLPYLVS